MIQENELRVGNIVEKNNVEYVADHVTIAMAHNYNPIPLTPEILEQCGFRFSENGNLGLEFPVRMALIFNEGNVGELDLVQDNNRISFKFGHMKYLYQLQNLYFALTGQELEVKL